jgi:hypothetical protein
MAACKRAQGRVDEGRAEIEEAYELCKQIGTEFIGPPILGAKASSASDPEARGQMLQQAEDMIERSEFSMSALLFYSDAIDMALERAQWSEALRYADALEVRTHPEPLVFTDLAISRARALVSLALNGRTPAVLAQLTALRDQIATLGIGSLLARVERALAA